MKKSFLVVAGILLFLPLIAQNKGTYLVTGKVIEKASGNGVPYATVVLKKDSAEDKKMVACDVSGKFSIDLDAPQSATITVTAVGHQEFSMPVNVTGLKTDLGIIALEEGIELKAVTVTAQKPLVRIDVDKVVYSIETDPEAQTNNALEMLAKVPLITVDGEENITLNGQSNFKVLVNGKSSTMMSSNLKEVLKSMPANSIKDIEVITNPSSKYDAEGVGGIINIITNKKTLNGFNGSLSTGVNSRGDVNWSTYLAASLGKFSFSGRYYGSQYSQPRSEIETTSEFYNNDDFHYSNMEGTQKYHGLSNGFSGEASYELDTLNLLSLSFWGYAGSSDNDSYRETQYMNTTGEITRDYNSYIISKNKYGILSGNIDYQRTFKKPDQSLTFSYKLDNNPEIMNYTNNINGITGYPSYHQHSKNKATGREQTLQIDYYDPLTSVHQIEGGLKFILRQNTSESEEWREEVRIEEGFDLDYDQYILGLYAGYVVKWKKISTKAGLRLERTWNDGISRSVDTTVYFPNRLFNLVPYITITYMPKQGQTIRTSYTQRLMRPGIWYLNPYVNDVDSMNINFGNPELVSEISHSFELGYSTFTPKFNFSLTARGSFINNSIESIIKVQPNGSRTTTYDNIGKYERIGLSSYINYRPTPKLNIYFNGNINYTKLEAVSQYTITNDGFTYGGSLGGRWTLWKNGTVNANAASYSSSIMLQGKSSNYFYAGLGVSQYLLKRKLMISLFASDPFWRKKSYKYEYSDITFVSNTNYSYLTRTLRLNITYNFGKSDLQVKKVRRGIQNDDLKSGGGSVQGGEGQQ